MKNFIYRGNTMRLAVLTRRFLSSLFVLGLLTTVGCAGMPTAQPIATTIANNPDLSTLSGLISKAGLTSTLNGTGSFTVFAPDNEAFKAVPKKTLDELAADPAKLTQVLTFHVIPTKAMAADVKTGPVKTANGANIGLAKAGTFVTVEDAVVKTADINATNGVVHIVDRVLMPPASR
jgi:uncharacterized surface protein with fasciclin (FAS1) repeats